MGAFYANITLFGPAQAEVLTELDKSKISALVSSTRAGFTVVADAESEEQDPAVLRRVTAMLSRRLKCVAIGVMNHDDDVLWFTVYDKGKAVDRYNSSPGYFNGDESKPRGGDAALLCKAFAARGAETKVNLVLRRMSGCDDEDSYEFESDRHSDLAKLLGLPRHSVGSTYSHPGESRSIKWTAVG